MAADIWQLFEKMYQARLYEDALTQFYREGLISGEYHSSAGEEAINAGVLAQLVEGDAMALDHRGTAPLLMRGLEPLPLVREIMGHPEGLCRGMGGHMHLFSKEIGCDKKITVNQLAYLVQILLISTNVLLAL